MSGEIVLSCENLAVGYKRQVLSGVDVAFESGHFIALLGPNGVGKTTLLRTLSRHLKPLSGRVTLLGRDLQSLPALELARQMAVVLTDKSRPPLLSVFEYVALGRYPHTGFMGRLSPRDVAVVEDALAAVAASDLAPRLIETLSDGERQKAVLARALAQDPKVLLLDEPTAHLDLKHRVEVMGILRDLCRMRGLTVIASLHDVDVAAKVSDRALLVKNGRVVDYGLPERVLTSEAVADLYDFAEADFSRHLGSIELRGDGSAGRAFVTAGLGHGAVIFRLLAKRGMAISTGVLAEGDLDAFVAEALGATAFVRRNGDAAESLLPQATAALEGCAFVIDGGPQTGPTAETNRKILSAAAARGLPVLPRETSADLAKLAAAMDGLQASRSAASF
jgi:iron complex transport system ATP-binding protein